uniref:Uncharacterized protein n=1 Tax=Hucho hucho TaxID=62062 RepID=A0A4W5Q8P0_9TELE
PPLCLPPLCLLSSSVSCPPLCLLSSSLSPVLLCLLTSSLSSTSLSPDLLPVFLLSVSCPPLCLHPVFLPPGPSSVFDLLKVEDRERLSGLRRPSSDSSSVPRQPTPGEARAAVVAAGVAAAAARASAQKALSSRFAPQAEQQQEALSVWSGPTAQAQTGQTFKPFERTPHKQARYDVYIDRLKQGDRDALELSLDPTMTEWERGRERDEFVRAALLYKPSSSSLSCRFTRGRQDDSVEADTVEVTRDQEVGSSPQLHRSVEGLGGVINTEERSGGRQLSTASP